MEALASTPKTNEQERSDQRSEAMQLGPVQDNVKDSSPHDSDDEPMVYVTPVDYKTHAHQERARLLAEGADPSSVILESELPSHVPRREGEPPGDYGQRYIDSFNDMIRRGVTILNDTTTADVVPDGFSIEGDRYFNLGPGSGATKKEYREFNEWLDSLDEKRQAEGAKFVPDVPERWLKFERPNPDDV